MQGPAPRGGMGWMGMGGPPPGKTKDVRATLRRLVGRLRPEASWIALVTFLAAASVGFAVIGPKIIGNATNVIFNGIIGKSLPAGITKAQAVAYLQAQGKGQLAQTLSGMDVTPGKGIDFTLLGEILLLAAAVYLLSSVFTWIQ